MALGPHGDNVRRNPDQCLPSYRLVAKLLLKGSRSGESKEILSGLIVFFLRVRVW